MNNKQIFLNGKEITKEVDKLGTSSIINDAKMFLCIVNEGYEKKLYNVILYKNGAEYKLGEGDKLVVIDTTPKKQSPEFKVGDYAAVDHRDGSTLFYRIDFLCLDKGKYSYSGAIIESKMRKPTKEELNLYFR